MVDHKQTSALDSINQINHFFSQYEQANSSGDVTAIGNLYADTFMFAGPNRLQAVRKEDFLKAVPRMRTYVSSLGVSETQLHSVSAVPLDSKYTLSKVEWRISMRNPSGSKYVAACATYILAKGADNTLYIVFQLDHQNLEDILKAEQGSLPPPGDSRPAN